MNASLVPSAMLGADGVIVIDISVAGVTVSVIAADVTLPSTAVIRLVPVATGEAIPALPEELLMVATAVVAEFQVTWLVRFCVELSE